MRCKSLSSYGKIFFVTGILCGVASSEETNPFLHSLFSDHMVIQRDRLVPVWGWTTPGQEVTVSLAGESATTEADEDGRWTVKLGPFAAGGPHTLLVQGPQKTTIEDVLIGDVWICSGQSNMEWPVAAANNPQEEIAAADHPQIRLFSVPKRIAMEPLSTVDGRWQICSPSTVGGFSAVGYYFGRTLHDHISVPVGLIHTSWGGTVAEAWTSAEALETMEDFRPTIASFRQMVEMQKEGQDKFSDLMTKWWQANDPGSSNGLGWAATDFAAADWDTMPLPNYWENAGLADYDGVAWFRKTVELSAEWAGAEATLELGPIDDRDTTWVNGVLVGGMNEWNRERSYKIPAGTLHEGENVIAVRVLDTGGNGGLCGQPNQMSLRLASGDAPRVSLAGPWAYRASAPLSKTAPLPQQMTNNPNVTTVLYNGMLAPLVPFGIRGAIWYQGESNAGRAYQYRTLLPTMIQDWRNQIPGRRFSLPRRAVGQLYGRTTTTGGTGLGRTARGTVTDGAKRPATWDWRCRLISARQMIFIRVISRRWGAVWHCPLWESPTSRILCTRDRNWPTRSSATGRHIFNSDTSGRGWSPQVADR